MIATSYARSRAFPPKAVQARALARVRGSVRFVPLCFILVTPGKLAAGQSGGSKALKKSFAYFRETGTAFFIPKGFRRIAQGCRSERLPWENGQTLSL